MTIIMEQNTQPEVFIRGMGSAIPGIGDPRIHNGHGGTLVQVSDVCEYLVKEFDIHNPKTGKRVDREWAKRNMGVDTISCGRLDFVKKELATKEYVETLLTDDMKPVLEQELGYIAFEEALERSNLKASDVDAILLASVTLHDLWGWESMRQWKLRFPDLKDDVQMEHHPLGCPAFLIELKRARQMLCSPEIRNVAIVVSNGGTNDVNREYMKAHGADNDMKKWINTALFGDGAGVCIVSSDTRNLPEMVFDVVDVEYRRNFDTNVATMEVKAVESEDGEMTTTPVFQLDFGAAKHFKGALEHWRKVLKKKHNMTFKKADHVSLHTPNPNVLDMVAKWYGITKKVSYLPRKVGNLAPASVVTNMYDRLHGEGSKIENGDNILGFAFGDALGIIDGIFLLKARTIQTDDDISTVASSCMSPDVKSSVMKRVLFKTWGAKKNGTSPNKSRSIFSKRTNKKVCDVGLSDRAGSSQSNEGGVHTGKR